MKISRLLKGMEFYFLNNNFFTDKNINGVKILEKNQSEFFEDIVYIGNLTSISTKSKLNSKPNLFLVRDSSDVLDIDANIVYFNNIDVLKLFNLIQDVFISESKRNGKELSLLRSLIDGKDIKYIVDLGCKILKNPILLTDSSLKLIAYGYYDKEGVDDKLWNELILKGYCSYEFICKFKENKIPYKINNFKNPIVLNKEFSKKIRRAIGSVKFEGKVMAYIAVLEYNNKFTDEDIEMIQLICEAISTELKKDNRIFSNRGLIYESLFFELIQGNINDDILLSDRMKAIGWNIGKRNILITIDLDKIDKENDYIDYIRAYIEDIFNGAKSIYHENHLVFLIDCEKCKYENEIIKLESFIKENNLIAGISTEFSSLVLLKKKFHESQRAIEIGKKLYKDFNLYNYEKLKLYDLLKAAGEKMNLMDFCPIQLIKLTNYDKKHNTDYMDTLKTYLYCNKNKSETAKKLFIHRNTLNYRINKIKEITNMEIEDFKEQYYLYIGFEIILLEKTS